MGKITPFPSKQPSKFGYERVKKRKKEDPDQLNLFAPGMGRVLRFPTSMSSFEVALLLDERCDDRTEEAYLRAIAEGDNVADAYCNIGVIQSDAGNISKAFDSFTRSLEHDPRHFESHYNLGNLYFEEENLRLAKMHYQLAAEINPEFPHLYFNLGLVLALMDEKRDAIGAFGRYRELAPPEECGNADDLIASLKKSLDEADRNTAQ